MQAIEFPEHNLVAGRNQPEYMPLPLHYNSTSGIITCCWKLTWRERLGLLLRGIVWHQVMTFGKPVQPQFLSAEKPPMPPDE